MVLLICQPNEEFMEVVIMTLEEALKMTLEEFKQEMKGINRESEDEALASFSSEDGIGQNLTKKVSALVSNSKEDEK